MTFKDHIVFITGGARGVGKVIAFQFAKEHASVIINDIDLSGAEAVAQEITQIGGLAKAVKADVSESSQVNRMVDQILSEFGRIDILINNAAVFAESVMVADLTDEEWFRVMHSNLDSVFYCSRAVIPHMIDQKSGKIVNLTSFTGKTGRVVYSRAGTPTKAHYCASKAGIISLTKSLAYELAPHNINVNAVAPGSIVTESADEEKKRMLKELVPLGRVGTADDVVGAVLFLASDQASFISGEIMDINGGTLMD